VRRTWALVLAVVPAPLAVLGIVASDATDGISIAVTMLAAGAAAFQLARHSGFGGGRTVGLVAASLGAYYAWLVPMLAALALAT
jgi:hypothetical protein